MNRQDSLELFTLLSLTDYSHTRSLADIIDHIGENGYISAPPTDDDRRDLFLKLHDENLVIFDANLKLFITPMGFARINNLSGNLNEGHATKKGLARLHDYHQSKRNILDVLKNNQNFQTALIIEKLREMGEEVFPYKELKDARLSNLGHFNVYVILLSDEIKVKKSRSIGQNPNLPAVYVGYSWHSPDTRFHKHLTDDNASIHVRDYGMRLLPELYKQYNPILTRPLAEETEAALAEKLRRLGFTVFGPR